MSQTEFTTMSLPKTTVDQLWDLKKGRERLSDVLERILDEYKHNHKVDK